MCENRNKNEYMKSLLHILKIHPAGFIDVIKMEDSCLIVEGWSLIFAEEPILTPQRIYLTAGEKILSELKTFNIDRPDVSKTLGSNVNSLCGFRFKLSEICDVNIDTIECFVESNENNLYQLQKSRGLSCWLQLELTGRCNLRCPQCPSALYSGFHHQDISVDDLQIVKPLFNKVNALCFDGFGEVLLAKHLEEALSIVPVNKPLEFHTNGMLIDKTADLLLRYAPPLRRMIVSLDSLKKPVYDILRKGGNLGTVLCNIRGFVEKRDASGQNFPKVVPNMTIMRDNYLEMKAFVDLASELDQMVEFLYLYDAPKLESDRSNIDFDYEKQRPIHFIKELRHELLQVIDYAKHKNVTISFSGSMTGLPNEVADINSFIGQRKPVCECTAATAGHCLQADGKFMLCVWQTAPIFNWRETCNVDPLKDPRGIKVVEMIKGGIIPKECSGAACEFVGRERSSDEYIVPAIFKSGGWQT